MAINQVTATLTAQNTFSAQLGVGGSFNFSISSIGSGNTVTLQRSFDNGATWLDVATYTALIQDRGTEPEGGMVYRFGVKTGQYGSGSVIARISQ